VELLVVGNERTEPTDVEVRLETASDFADLFDVKDAQAKKGEAYTEVHDGCLVLGYRRDGFVRETHVVAHDAEVTEEGLVFRVRLEPNRASGCGSKCGPWPTGVSSFQTCPQTAQDGRGCAKPSLSGWPRTARGGGTGGSDADLPAKHGGSRGAPLQARP
jgi:hypothetical protein